MLTRRNTHKDEEELDLSVCANRLGPAPAALTAWQNVGSRPADLVAPPYTTADTYLSAFARHLDARYNARGWTRLISPRRMLAGRGVSEFLSILGRVLPDTALVAPEYSGTLKAFRGAAIYAPADGEHDTAAMRLQRVEQAMNRHMYVVISNPSNPLGHYIRPHDLLVACRDNPQSVLVVDEEYIDFQVDGVSLIHPATNVDNLVVLRSTGKSFGLTGTRAGLLWTRREILRDLVSGQIPPFALSAVDTIGVVAALADTTWLADTLEEIRADAAVLEQLLGEHFGDRVTSSEIHYRFVHAPDPQTIAAHLAEHRIIVRPFEAREQVGTSGVRFATPHGPRERERLDDALAALPGHGARRRVPYFGKRALEDGPWIPRQVPRVDPDDEASILPPLPAAPQEPDAVRTSAGTHEQGGEAP